MRAAVERHVDLVWRMLRRAGLGASVAEEAAREVFWVFSRRAERVPEKAGRAFLASVALRVASELKSLKWQRSATNALDLDRGRSRTLAQPRALEPGRALDLLDEALRKLGEADRAVFVLAELEQLPLAEIAAVLDISESTVAPQLEQALVGLEKALRSVESTGAVTTELDDGELLPVLVQASRSEQAPDELGEIVIERVEHWMRLDHYLPRETRWPAFAMVGATVVAGTTFALSLRRAPEAAAIAVEPAPVAAPKQALTADPCATRARAPGLEPLIDDFEDGDDALASLEQRVGFWRWVRDIDAPGTAPALLPVPRPDRTRQNRLALHVKGGRLHDWGAVIVTTFRPACYDASEYAGVAFQARGRGRIYFGPRETTTIPIAEGGTCEEDCHDPHLLKIDLEPSFERYEVRWEELRQRGVDKPALDPRKLNSLAFLIRPEDTPYDVWLDDVRFLRR